MESIFIAWGRNRRLAEELKAELEKDAAHRIVVRGGTEGDQDGSYFLGQNIQNQMTAATSAVVLIGLEEREGDSSSLLPPAKEYSMRPNLAFELGFLWRQFNNPRRLHVFLVGVGRDQLPADLGGLQLDSLHTLKLDGSLAYPRDYATKIVKIIGEDIRTSDVRPSEIFEDAETWLLRYKDSNDDDLKAQILLHLIQPLFLLSRITELERLGDGIRGGGASPALVATRALVSAVCKYYALPVAPTPNEVTHARNLHQDLAMARPGESAWQSAIRQNFDGLTLRYLAAKGEERERDLRESASCFRSVIERVKKTTPADPGAQDLWLGYATRNLGRSLLDLKQPKEIALGVEEINAAIKLRSTVRDRFSSGSVHPAVKQQLSHEVTLARLDLAEHGHSSSPIEDIKAAFYDLSASASATTLWRSTAAQAKRAIVRMKERATTEAETAEVAKWEAKFQALAPDIGPR